MDDEELTRHHQRRGEDARREAPYAFQEDPVAPVAPLHTPPPRWSRVIVEPPDTSPLTAEQKTSLDTFLTTLPDLQGRSMAAQRRIWIQALAFSSQLSPQMF
jgi:hypothetical protein